jgi:N,N-dimethylformamidase
MLPLTGYADRWSVAPGETIEFKISSRASAPYEARLVRVICADPNPDGPGIKEKPVAADFAGRYPSREQPVRLGSYAKVADTAALRGLSSFTLAATIWPTTPNKGRQGIVAKYDPALTAGFALFIDADGAGALAGDVTVSAGKPLRERAWYRVWASFDAASKLLSVGQAPLAPAFGIDEAASSVRAVDSVPLLDSAAPLLIAAFGGEPLSGHYNGKIERPWLASRALSAPDEIDDPLAAWDFSQAIPSTRIKDTGPHGLHGELSNLPARAMTGSNWSGAEMCWRHVPEQYGAIHFHDDDIYDCGWQTDFSFTVPADFKSGVYAVRLTCGEHEDMIPFFVRPPQVSRTAQSKICVLIPTFTYTVYGNYARGVTDAAYRARVAEWGARPWTTDEHRDYGLSTYNFHSDGSGICYGSYLRPMITQRSAFLAYVDPHGSGLRHFPADTHLFDWLEAKGHAFDVITDHDLHAEGAGLIAPYKTILTTTHPEYQTRETLDALQTYLEQGGRLMYLGGNGFYWRVALNPDLPGAVEIRRGEGGIRAWAAEPGEYYHSFDGCYGGLWRRNGRPPQQLVGVGFTSQGVFEGSYYRRRPDADDPRAAWIFAGVDEARLGDFGLSGGGAGGFELDRADRRLGTPAHALILASSEGHIPEHFVLVHEDWLTDRVTWSGEPPEKLIRADMIYFETPQGGAVFSVGSITFCGSLAHNNYDNNISRIVENVLTRFGST